MPLPMPLRMQYNATVQDQNLILVWRGVGTAPFYRPKPQWGGGHPSPYSNPSCPSATHPSETRCHPILVSITNTTLWKTLLKVLCMLRSSRWNLVTVTCNNSKVTDHQPRNVATSHQHCNTIPVMLCLQQVWRQPTEISVITETMLPITSNHACPGIDDILYDMRVNQSMKHISITL